VGWDGEGRERKGEEGRDGKKAGGKYCFMAVGGGGWTPLCAAINNLVYEVKIDINGST
jgi:hypothetical protein